MKRFVRFLLLLSISSLTACRLNVQKTPAPGEATPSPTEQPPFDTAVDDRGIFATGLIAQEEAVLEELKNATFYRIDLRIAEDLLHLEGWQQVYYTNREDQALDEVFFRLYPNLTGGVASVSETKVDGKVMEPVYELERSALRVPLETPLQPGAKIEFEMQFSVELPTEMAGNYGLFGSFDNFLTMQEFYPLIPVYDDEGWNVEIPPTHGDLTYLDASFYLVRVTAPGHLTLIASGPQVDRKEKEGFQELTFAIGPARDFYLVASDQFETTSSTFGETQINSYTFPEYSEGSTLALQIVAKSLEGFNRRLGAFPYSELDIVSIPMQALGMEYPGVIAINIDLYDPDTVISGLPAQVILESTLAHEVAHQWFYNVVGNDQVDEPWVDEAPTQYATWLYYVDRYGERNAEGFRQSWLGRWDRVERADIPIGLPTADYDPQAYGAIVYGRGPLFIEALAEEMGQETFDTFLRSYYETNKWGLGTSDGFRQLGEETCQCDLSALFATWVFELE